MVDLGVGGFVVEDSDRMAETSAKEVVVCEGHDGGGRTASGGVAASGSGSDGGVGRENESVWLVAMSAVLRVASRFVR